MIVVIGALGLRGTVDEPVPGRAGARDRVAAAAAVGARVELISKAGDDPAGDAVLLALAQAGVGHVATLRDPARLTPVRPLPARAHRSGGSRVDARPMPPTAALPMTGRAHPPTTGLAPAMPQPTLDAADIALALRYLTDFEVLVAVHPTPDLLAEAVSAAAWAGARLVVVVEPRRPSPAPASPRMRSWSAAASDDAEGVGATDRPVRRRPVARR